MSATNGGGPAFPVPMLPGEVWNAQTYGDPNGLTKREWFAGMALQGLAESVFRDAQLRRDDPANALIQLVNGCVNIADAMIATLGKEDP